MSMGMLAHLVGLTLATVVAADPSMLAGAALTSVLVVLATACLVVLAAVVRLEPAGPAGAHRQLVDALPAPRHPNTAGRRRARAPSSSVVVT